MGCFEQKWGSRVALGESGRETRGTAAATSARLGPSARAAGPRECGDEEAGV